MWDCPGVNDDFKIFDPDTLGYFQCADRIFILFCDSPKTIKEIIVVLSKIKPDHTYLVRTKCDSVTAMKHKKTIEE